MLNNKKLENIEFFIHIGLHKTGSTYLQKKIFPEVEGAQFIGPYCPPEEYSSKIEKGSKKVIISDEGYSGNLKKTNWQQRNFLDTFKEAVDSIVDQFGKDVMIIMFIRNHPEWLESLYRSHLKYDGTISPRDYFTVGGFFKYDDLSLKIRIDYITERFGKPPVLFLQEDLINRHDTVINKLTSLMGVDNIVHRINKSKSNVGVNKTQANILLQMNRVKVKSEKSFFYKLIYKGLRKMGWWPKEYRLKKYFKAAPRSLLTPGQKSAIEKIFHEDWNYAKKFNILNK